MNMKKTFVFLAAAFSMAAAGLAADVAGIAERALERIPDGTIAFTGRNGWLYGKSELAHLAAGELAGGKIAAHSKASQAAIADPVPAIAAFNDELEAEGIRLIVMPVPPKCALEPIEGLERGDAMAYLRPFYEELHANGVEIVDLYNDFSSSPEPVYCKQDSHWNQAGIKLAAKKIARISGLPPGGAEFEGEDGTLAIAGDLMLSLDKDAPPSEELSLTRYSGETVDETSPVLLLGDSHVLVFSSGGDMLAERAGLAECLAAELKMPVDRIGVKGSASAVVRMNLYRKAAKDQAWLRNKKVIVWCFSAREFTESTGGWPVVPVTKK